MKHLFPKKNLPPGKHNVFDLTQLTEIICFLRAAYPWNIHGNYVQKNSL